MLLFAALPLIALAVPLVLGGLDYLRRQLLPSAPPTEPLSKPYTPPFSGGQCPKLYNVSIPISYTLGGAPYTYTFDIINVMGAIASIERNPVNGIQYVVTNTSGDKYHSAIGSGDNVVKGSVSIVPVSGSDNCGDIPNPSPSGSVGDNGLATSAPPNPNNFLPLITGIAAATAAAFLAAKAAAAAALAAAKAAAVGGNLAGAIAKIADALAEILKLLAELEKKKKKEEDKEKTVSQYDFGKVKKDGFLRLYPNENLAKQELSYLDVQVENVPTYTGKYFGQLSPHHYRYKSLGYISFVSPTFGILETRQIDFKRLSLNPPENAFGFFYHFGLEGILEANLTGFYTKKEEEAEPPAT